MGADTGVDVALVLCAATVAGPAAAWRWLENPRHVSVLMGVASMFMGGVLVHLGQGPVQIEMHFYFFAVIAMCAVFGNPMVIVAAAVTVALHHLVLWAVLPASVFNYDAPVWVVAVHATFVVLESVAAVFIARSFHDNVIGLEKIVAARTEALDRRNQDMRLVMDNVDQGFARLDAEGRLSSERSAVLQRWFGALPADAHLWDLMAAVSPALGAVAQVGWQEVRESVMPLAVTLDQLPTTFEHQGRHYRAHYRPLDAAEPPASMMFMVSDITDEVVRARGETERMETLRLFERLLSDRTTVDAFFEDGGPMVEAILGGALKDPLVLRRQLHTLKGNAGVLGLDSVASLAHAMEDALEDGDRIPAGMLAALASRWSALMKDLERILGSKRRVIEMDESQFLALEQQLRLLGPRGAGALEALHGLRLEPTRRRLEHFADQARRIGQRLNKDVMVAVEDNGIRLDDRRWTPFWGVFIHAVRSAVDHGIEQPDHRMSAGKSPHGKLTLRTELVDGHLRVEVEDDGSGVNLERLVAAARRRGLEVGAGKQVTDLLFEDGVSTAESVTDLSGRGVGMGALKQAAQELGGVVEVSTKVGMGTLIRMDFPADRASASSSQAA